MSGRKQHYLPQFLQRPFCHRVVKENCYVHVHEQRLRYSPNTTGVGAIRDFYSSAEDTRADDNITALESELGELVETTVRTRQLPSDLEVSRLFSSLSIRTLKMRNAMRDLAPTMFQILRERATKDAWAKQAFDKTFNNDTWIDAQIEEELRRIGRTDRSARRVMKAKMRPKLKEKLHARKSQVLADFNEIAQATFDRLEAQAASIADDALSKIFCDTQGLQKRDAVFAQFAYALVAPDSESFVLGDCAVVALDSKQRPRIALGDIDEEVVLEQVFLPISPNLLIHGTRNLLARRPGSAEINKISVILSNHFFISLEAASPHIEDLKALIGTSTTPILSKEDLG